MAGMASTASSSNAGLFLLACLVSTLTWGGDWKFATGVGLSERYSDNVALATTGLEESAWITEITPRISVKRDGGRVKANVDYSLQALLYADDGGSNRINHNLNGRLNAELVKEWFYLDATARMSQALKSLTGGIGAGDGVGASNTTSVGSYTISPSLKRRLGSVATVEAKISRDGVFIGDSSVSDTSSTRYQLSAISGNDFYPFSWGANFNKTNTSNSGAADSGSEQASVNARYQLGKKFGLLANASIEKNDFSGASATARDYSSYGVGAFYTPSRRFSMDALYNHSAGGNFVSGSVSLNPTLRTSVKATTSKRAFGRSHTFNLSHRTRKLNWSLTYQNDLTTSQQQFANFLGNVFVYTCPGGKEYLPTGVQPSDPVNCSLDGVGSLFSQTQVNETYLAKNLVGTVSYTLRRSTWRLSMFDNQRQLQASGGSDKTRGLQASWSLKPAAHTTFTLTGGMTQVEASTGTLQDDLWNIGLVATHQFKPKISGSVEARHQERKSNQPTGDFSENSVAARLNMSF
jgi:uncharacterized protein (PEP-CTERM system associated)